MVRLLPLLSDWIYREKQRRAKAAIATALWLWLLPATALAHGDDAVTLTTFIGPLLGLATFLILWASARLFANLKERK